MKHTQGPWTLEKIDDAEKTLVYYRVNSGKNTLGFAGVYHNRKLTDEECTANAKLIAAAPDMLIALQKAVEVIERMSDEYSAIANRHASYTVGEAKIIEGAIKKATE